jgi:predicted amidohydrolase YtcJ
MAQLAGGEPDKIESQLRDAAAYYASFGITTAQDASVGPDDITFLKSVAAKQALPIDIAAYPVVNQYPLEAIGRVQREPEYSGGYRIAGAKLSLDGSPQGRTAWMTKPYMEGPEGADANYVAYPTLDPQTYYSLVAALIGNGVPILAHANGDAAIDMMLNGVAGALDQQAVSEHRSVIIHAQLMREDQLDRAKELGVVPSFFSAHPFFWGDWHRVSFGDERALNISPTRWATDRGVLYTIHNDSPVVPPDMMRLWWATVNRKTRSGFVLGEEQRATVHEALNAMTLAAAYQYFEEDSKGSITTGKQADLVILDRDPMSADPDTLKDIRILETIARGKTVFAASVGATPSRDSSPIDLARCETMSGAAIEHAFADVVDSAEVRDIEDGEAKNHWFADGRFTSEWSGAGSRGRVAGTWHIEGDQRCVTIGSGIADAEDHETCSPIYKCGDTMVSVNPDGTIHGVHHVDKLQAPFPARQP